MEIGDILFFDVFGGDSRISRIFLGFLSVVVIGVAVIATVDEEKVEYKSDKTTWNSS